MQLSLWWVMAQPDDWFTIASLFRGIVNCGRGFPRSGWGALICRSTKILRTCLFLSAPARQIASFVNAITFQASHYCLNVRLNVTVFPQHCLRYGRRIITMELCNTFKKKLRWITNKTIKIRIYVLIV